MALHIVLVEPEIPPNTGNIARTAAATDSVLHLVKPLGFSIDDKSLKRAGLDYWPFVKLEVHESLDEFMAKYGDRRMWLATTKGGRKYTDVSYEDEDMLLFGRETAGLPRDFIACPKSRQIRVTVVTCRLIIAWTRSRSAESNSLKKNIPALFTTISGRSCSSRVHQAYRRSAASAVARS